MWNHRAKRERPCGPHSAARLPKVADNVAVGNAIQLALDRALRTERRLSDVTVAGLLLVCAGAAMVIRPFGPSLSNPSIVPKADPYAGLALLQSLPLFATQVPGAIAIVLGGALLLCVRWLRRHIRNAESLD